MKTIMTAEKASELSDKHSKRLADKNRRMELAKYGETIHHLNKEIRWSIKTGSRTAHYCDYYELPEVLEKIKKYYTDRNYTVKITESNYRHYMNIDVYWEKK